MKGRKPTPLPTADATSPTPEPGLSPAAQHEWDKLMEVLEPMQILHEIDEQSLWIFATSMARYRHAESQIEQHGPVVLSRSGTPDLNPYCRVQREAWERIRPLLSEFGLTPSARARLNITGPADDVELEF